MTVASLSYLHATKSMPALSLPVASPLVQLDAARLLISPGSGLSAEQLASAGAITDLVAPSLLHTAGIAAAARAHPKARLWGPIGAREKHPDLTWHGLFGADPWPYASELPFVTIGGMPRMQETVFVHRATKTLLCSDLTFNIEDPRGFGSWLIYSMFGTYKKFAVSRFFLMQVKDRAAFIASLGQLLALDFDAIAPSHGSVLPSDGKARLVAALAERGYAV